MKAKVRRELSFAFIKIVSKAQKAIYDLPSSPLLSNNFVYGIDVALRRPK